MASDAVPCARMVQKLAAQGIADARVLRAMGTVERHRFVDSALVNQAYEDTSLPIGLGQTISKPNVVARMIELLLAGRTGARRQARAACWTPRTPHSSRPRLSWRCPTAGPAPGSTIVLVQQWVHDRTAWESIGVPAQELAMGRTKAESIELADDVKPVTSHVARTVIENADGEELDIFRRNTPYGTAGDHGTMFVGFSFEQARLHRMLLRMAGAEDGIRDELTRYTTPLTGAYYVVPSIEALGAFAPPASD